MLERFGEEISGLDFKAPEIPILSNTTGELLTPEQATDPAYWVAHARQPVRFADALKTLKEQGASACLELGPGGVLAAIAQEALGAEAIPTLREQRGEGRSLALAFASALAAGAKPDWSTFFKDTKARAVPLPTYPFQRKRYWLNPSSGGSDPSALGLSSTEHPFLGASVEDPEGEGLILTGRISLSAQPWLADHVVFERPVLPGTAFLELALAAASKAGCQTVEELALQAPLTLPETGGVSVQVRVGGPGERGEREVSIHSRPEAREGEAGEWTRHCQGTLSPEAPEPPESLESWPPQGAEPLELDGLYQRLGEIGLEYGPAFQAVRAAWRHGGDVFVEVSGGRPAHAGGASLRPSPGPARCCLPSRSRHRLGWDRCGEAGSALLLAWCLHPLIRRHRDASAYRDRREQLLGRGF